MNRNNPEEVFKSAQKAMEVGDYHGFFICLDPADLRKIMNNAFKLSMSKHGGKNDEFRAICERHSIPLRELQDVWKKMEWRRYDEVLKTAFKNVFDVAALMADLEKHSRAVAGGGSISKKLFIGEVLLNLDIADKKAWAERKINDKYSEPIGFLRKKDGWYIKLFVKSRQ